MTRDAPGLILQHGELGPPGVLGDWLRERGIGFEVRAAGRDPLPRPGEARFVASLGSRSSVRDRDPGWIPAELQFVRASVAAGVPVLGLCFGGQVLSSALGGGIDRLERTEIGWIAIESERPEEVPEGPWLHWHGDALRVPPGAEALAHSPAGPAAFRHGRHLGVQFHPEATPEIVAGWAAADPELERKGVTPETLAEQAARCAPGAREAAYVLFDRWWAAGPGAA